MKVDQLGMKFGKMFGKAIQYRMEVSLKIMRRKVLQQSNMKF